VSSTERGREAEKRLQLRHLEAKSSTGFLAAAEQQMASTYGSGGYLGLRRSCSSGREAARARLAVGLLLHGEIQGDGRKALRLTESQWQLWKASTAPAACLRARRDHELGRMSCNGRGVISAIMPAEIDVKPRKTCTCKRVGQMCYVHVQICMFICT
jgi:hypothetical protein